MLARKGGTLERVDGRADHRTRPGGRRDPPRVVLRGTRQAQAAAQLPEGAALAALATRWKYGSKARRPGELVQRALARIDPHDLHRWRADAEGVPSRLSGLQVHGDAGLLARHRRQCQTLPDGPPRRTAVPVGVGPSRRRQRVHGPVRGCLRGTAPHRRCAHACTSCRPGGPSGTAAWSGPTARPGSSCGTSTTVR